ncbi:MAG: type II secretion system-associated lipoprotein [Spirochaetota bacterium]
MKKINPVILIIIYSLLFISCTTFLQKEDIPNIKDFEKREYILKDDAGDGVRFLKKGTRIKLLIQTSDESVKVYCYPAGMDFVKAERTLILYMFEDDFEKSRFKMQVFEEKLYKKIDIAKK